MSDGGRGHRARPHTADARIEAWGPTAAACYEEAVAALVGLFADVSGAPAGTSRRITAGPGSPERLLVELLDEVLTCVDAEGLVPRRTRVVARGDTLAADLDLVPLGAVRVAGSAAKGVSYGGLGFAPDGRGGWRCRATVDV
ncbi:MAG TPA: archease [Acidimicrobiales bacterium]